MTYDTYKATMLNDEVRADALHEFVSVLKPLGSVVFPSLLKDLPSAMALAKGAEASMERSAFAVSYAKALEEKAHIHNNNM